MHVLPIMPGVEPPGNTAAGFLGGLAGGLSDLINTPLEDFGEYLGSTTEESPWYNFKPNVLGPDGITYVWDPDSQSYTPEDAYGQPTPVPPDPDLEDEADADADDPPIDDWDPVPGDNPPIIGPDGDTWVWDPETNSYRPADPLNPDDPGNWWDDRPPWWNQFPVPQPRPSANVQYPLDIIGEIWKMLAKQGMEADPGGNVQDEWRHSQDQQNAFNLRRMIEEAALTRQESRQSFLSPFLGDLIGGLIGDGEGGGGSGVGPVGMVLRGLGMHSRYIEGGEGEGAGPVTVVDKPREVQARRYTGMLPASTSGRLGAAAPQFAQALGSRGETVRQQAEERVGRASAAQATQSRAQAGQQGLGLSGQVIGMQRQAERLEDAKRRSKRGVLKPVLQELMGQV